MIEYSAGIVTAYGSAVRAGYTGTYEDFCRQQAQYANNASAVEQAKQTAVSASQSADQAKQDAQTASTTAQQSAQSAQGSAQSAGQSAQDAQTAKNNAQTYAQSASQSAGSAQQSAQSAQAVLESIPEDYSDLSEDVDQLKADLDATNNDLRKMVGNIPGEWVLGGMYSATGIEYYSSSVIRTPFIQVEPGDTIYFDNPDTSLVVTVFEFANNTPTSAGVNERLAITGVTNLSKKITLGGTTNYIRLQMATGNTLKGDDVLAYTKHGVVFDSITEASEAIKNEMDGKYASEPIIPIAWGQGRLSTSDGKVVSTDYAIHSKDFISVDENRKGITVIFGDYDMPAGTGVTNLSCRIYEYSSTNPVTLIGNTEYKKRNGRLFEHTFSSNAVAFKITLSYLVAETAAMTPDKGYLITPMWTKDGLPNVVVSTYDWEHGKYSRLAWEQGRITTTGGETSANPPRIRTGYININGIKKLLINAPVNTIINYYWYGRDKTFQSYSSYSLIGIRASNRTIVDIPDGAYFVRIVIGISNNPAITVSYGANVSIYNFDAINNGGIITNPPMLTIIDDDSFSGFYTDIYPVMVAKNVPVSCAVIVGDVGTTHRMTWEEISNCSKNGMEILSHSYSHFMPPSDDPSLEEISADYRKAKQIIAAHGIYTPNLLVFPGSSGLTQKFITAAKQNYEGAFVAGSNTTNLKGLYKYAIRRYRVGDNTDYHIDIDVLKGLIDTLTSGWMVWMVHTSAATWVSGTGEGSSAYVLGQAVDYALSKGIPVVTAECGFRTYSDEWSDTQAPEY